MKKKTPARDAGAVTGSQLTESGSIVPEADPDQKPEELG